MVNLFQIEVVKGTGTKVMLLRCLWVGGWDGLPPGAGMMISSVSVVGRLYHVLMYYGTPRRRGFDFPPVILRRPTHLS